MRRSNITVDWCKLFLHEVSMDKKPVVLIAEDNELNLKLFRDLLAMQDIAHVCVSDGKKVIEKALESMPDLILMDLRLNNISGLDLVDVLRGHHLLKKIPIVVLTAFATKQDREVAMSRGCAAYLTKPVKIDIFYDTIKQFLKY